MSKWRWFFLSLPVIILAVGSWSIWSEHVAKKQAAIRELAYAKSLDELQQVVHPGMSRVETERLLKAQSLAFTNISGLGTYDDIVPLAREPSREWFCDHWDISILIKFLPGSSPSHAGITHAGLYEAKPDDRVQLLKILRIGTCL